MPKGSFNGRPFRDDPNSYSNTGVPCGNPLRYQSTSVLRMTPDHSSKRRQLDMPVEDIETEAERQLKLLLEKQTDTSLSMKGHVEKYRKFTQSTMYKPLTKEASGQMSLSSYKELASHDRQVESLRQLGLTEEEIQFKLDQGHSLYQASNSKRRKYGADPLAIVEKLSVIEDKIISKTKDLEKPDKFAGAKVLSRHEMDLENAISHNKDNAKLLNCLIQQGGSRKVVSSPDLQSNLNILLPTHKASRKTQSQSGLLNNVNRVEQNMSVTAIKGQKRNTIVHTSRNSKQQIDTFIPESDEDTDDEVDIVVQEPLPTDVIAGPPTRRQYEKERALAGNVDIIPQDVILKYKLNLDELKMIPRFKDYIPGIPSCTLFLKNLSPKITEVDLVSLFKRYDHAEHGQIDYKLLTGRMKGQAFVTFDSVEKATEALTLVNGYPLKGKPIVIVYGKKSNTSNTSTKVESDVVS